VPRAAGSKGLPVPPAARALRPYRDDVKLATAANNTLAANVTVPDSVEATAEDGTVCSARVGRFLTGAGAAQR
jgi:hypothetical protein